MTLALPERTRMAFVGARESVQCLESAALGAAKQLLIPVAKGWHTERCTAGPHTHGGGLLKRLGAFDKLQIRCDGWRCDFHLVSAHAYCRDDFSSRFSCAGRCTTHLWVGWEKSAAPSGWQREGDPSQLYWDGVSPRPHAMRPGY
jgi:hypothetical protein